MTGRLHGIATVTGHLQATGQRDPRHSGKRPSGRGGRLCRHSRPALPCTPQQAKACEEQVPACSGLQPEPEDSKTTAGAQRPRPWNSAKSHCQLPVSLEDPRRSQGWPWAQGGEQGLMAGRRTSGQARAQAGVAAAWGPWGLRPQDLRRRKELTGHPCLACPCGPLSQTR